MTRELVLVEWEDAKLLDNETTWVSADTKSEYSPLIVRQVGFVLEDSEQGLILTHALSDAVMAPRDQIPRSMIRRIVKLKTPRAPKNAG